MLVWVSSTDTVDDYRIYRVNVGDMVPHDKAIEWQRTHGRSLPNPLAYTPIVRVRKRLWDRRWEADFYIVLPNGETYIHATRAFRTLVALKESVMAVCHDTFGRAPRARHDDVRPKSHVKPDRNASGKFTTTHPSDE